MRHAHTLNRILNQPLLVEPGYLQVALGGLSERLGINGLTDGEGYLDQSQLTELAGRYDPKRPYERGDHYSIEDGIARITVRGSLVSRTGSLKPFSGMTGYNSIKERLEYAISDPEVSAILLDLDSPGGEVAGLFDLLDYMHSLRGTKPLLSLIDGSACSACFAIASQTERRFITQHSRTGSVGVVLAHMSIKGHLEKEGIKVTLIHAGDHKVDGNPYQDLPEALRDELQAQVNDTYSQFVQVVARGIGMDEDAIRRTQARVYAPSAALSIGFADELVNGFDVTTRIQAYLSQPKNGAIAMTQAASAQAEGTPTTEQAEVEQPSTAQAAPVVADSADFRSRTKAILSLSAATAQPKLAQAIALETDLDATQAALLLDAAAQDKPAAEASTRDAREDFNQAMSEASAAPLASDTPASSANNTNPLLAALHRAQGK